MYEKETFPNGMRTLVEHMPGVCLISLGTWMGTGSRHENAGENETVHLVEHMSSKGTRSHTIVQLVEEMDAVGGQTNALTTEECICSYVQMLGTHLTWTAGILCDIFFHSRSDGVDVGAEREVILKETGMYEDNPEDPCAEWLAGAIFKGSPLTQPILGRKATLDKMDRTWLRAYQRAHYRLNRIMVALAGSFTDTDTVELAERFAGLEAWPHIAARATAYVSGVVVKRGTTEQNHLALASPGLSFADLRRFQFQFLSSILGGGMPSRLFQQMREQRELCYSIYSYGTCHDDTGYFGVYTALGQETEGQTLDTILVVIRELTEHDVIQAELDRTWEQSKANVLMGLESTQSHMNDSGRDELLQGEVLGEDTVVAAYDAMTRASVQALAGELFRFENTSLPAVGRMGSVDVYRALLY